MAEETENLETCIEEIEDDFSAQERELLPEMVEKYRQLASKRTAVLKELAEENDIKLKNHDERTKISAELEAIEEGLQNVSRRLSAEKEIIEKLQADLDECRKEKIESIVNLESVTKKMSEAFRLAPKNNNNTRMEANIAQLESELEESLRYAEELKKKISFFEDLSNVEDPFGLDMSDISVLNDIVESDKKTKDYLESLKTAEQEGKTRNAKLEKELKELSTKYNIPEDFWTE